MHKKIKCGVFLFIFLCLPLFCKPSIEVSHLRNGIPVYVAREESRVFAVRIEVRGGAAFLDEDTSGLERSTFSWMTYGSKKYSKDDIDKMAYDLLFSVSSSASQDSAALYVDCIDKYAKKAVDVLCDMFVNPAFEEETLRLLMDGIKSSLAVKKEDAEAMLSDTISKTIYANHPYRVKSFVTDRSLPFITRENMIALHKKDMDSRRIFVVASGGITAASLASMMNRTIGRIPALAAPLDAMERDIPPISIDGDNVTIPCKALDGTGYMQWVAPGPAVTDEDAAAALVASQMYSRQLFNVVREAYGACYSAQSLCSAGKIGMAGVYLHSVSDLSRAVQYEGKARSLLSEGFLASSNGEGGGGGALETQSAGDEIEGIKNAFLNSYFESSASRSAVCSRIAYSISVLGDPEAYGNLIERISTVTKEEALSAFNKYWTQKGQWFAVVGPSDTEKVSY